MHNILNLQLMKRVSCIGLTLTLFTSLFPRPGLSKSDLETVPLKPGTCKTKIVSDQQLILEKNIQTKASGHADESFFLLESSEEFYIVLPEQVVDDLILSEPDLARGEKGLSRFLLKVALERVRGRIIQQLTNSAEEDAALVNTLETRFERYLARGIATSCETLTPFGIGYINGVCVKLGVESSTFIAEWMLKEIIPAVRRSLR
ncbi:MAG: hypothetical protein AAGE59_28440 [Cyanobacteria bacterium P01_F01_bin.86]